jgi:holo-[acyl-carrier protein] synthase
MDVGIDIQKISAFKEFKKNKNFYNHIFTEKEIEYCLKKSDYKSCFCAKFCGKEAVIKALDKKVSLKEIEILNSPSGKPYVKIKSVVQKNLVISLSHSDGICVGVAIKK